MSTPDKEDSPPDPTYPPRGGAMGAPTKFENNQYKANMVMYPADLLAEPTDSNVFLQNEYGQNYVVFYINVHQDSALIGKGATIVEGAVPPRMSGDLAISNLNGATVTAGTAIAGGLAAKELKIGSGAVNVVSKAAGVVVGEVNETVLEGAKAAADVTVGALAAVAVATTLAGVKGEYKRIDTAIALHMPTDLSIKYGASWETSSAAAAAATALYASAEGLAGAVEDAVKAPFTDKTMGDAMKSGSAGLRIGASAITGATLQIPGAGEVASKFSGVAANPKREQIFKQVDYRTFSFSYQFFPRSKEEADAAKRIIYLFKLHMHPEYKKDSFNYLYLYPSEFDIFYYHGSEENMNIHRHTSCVLTDLAVSYSPQGIFSTFADGTPTQINLQLTFKELATLSKETIQDGF